MEKLQLQSSKKDPEVIFDHESGVLEIRGKLIPEDGWKYFTPLFEWIEAYAEECPKEVTHVNLAFEYINTSASKCVLKFLQTVEKIHKEGKTRVDLKWFHDPDDIDMQEAGEEYQAIIQVPFSIIPEDI